MAKPEWGQKRICPQCGARYYDMKKKPPVCPQCGAIFDEVTKTRKPRPAPEEKQQKAAPTPEEIEDIPLDSDEADDSLIEDADELGEDDVDVEEVIDVETGKEDL